jgi:flagellar biogenesis protein FliO
LGGRVVLRRAIFVGGLWAATLTTPIAELRAQPARIDGTVLAVDETSSLDRSASSKRPLPARSPNAGATGAQKSRASVPTASIWGTVAALAVVLAGIAVAGRYFRTHGPAALRTLPNEAVEPLGQRLLGRGVVVHLVRCGSRVLLVGVGPDGARTLSEITDPVEVDLLTGACRRRDADRPSFAQVLRRREPASTPVEPVPRFNRPLATEVDGV